MDRSESQKYLKQFNADLEEALATTDDATTLRFFHKIKKILNAFNHDINNLSQFIVAKQDEQQPDPPAPHKDDAMIKTGFELETIIRQDQQGQYALTISIDGHRLTTTIFEKIDTTKIRIRTGIS